MLHRFLRRSGERARRRRCALRQSHPAAPRGYNRGDTSAYARLIGDSLVHIDDRGNRRNRAAVMRYAKENAGGRARYEIGETHVRRSGTLAVVDCEVVEYIPFGPREQRIRARELDVFEQHGARWLRVQHAETPVLAQPDSVASDSVELGQYVGRYEWYPRFVDTITRRGDHLYILLTGETEATELVHFLDGRLESARRAP